MRFTFYLILMTFPLFSGCVAIDGVNNVISNNKAKYLEQTVGDTANLRAFYGDTAHVDIYPNSTSLVEIKKDKHGGSVSTKRYLSGLSGFEFERKSIGMPYTPVDHRIFAEYKVPANRPFIITLFYSSSELKGNYNVTQTCKKRYYKVNLEPNKNYGVEIKTVNKRCSYRIFEYEIDGSEKVLTNIELLR